VRQKKSIDTERRKEKKNRAYKKKKKRMPPRNRAKKTKKKGKKLHAAHAPLSAHDTCPIARPARLIAY
jgi:hypothetical protein